MRKNPPFRLAFTRALCISILLLVASALHGAESHAEELILTNGEWPPYTSETFKHGGVLSRLCAEAFAEEGVNVEYEYFPWTRALDMARECDVDGSVAWRKTAEREKDFYFSDPVISEPMVFFHRLGPSFDWETLDDIGSLRVGVVLGYLHSELLKEAVRRNGGKIDFAPSEFLSFQKLIRGRVDVVPASMSVGHYILQTQFTPEMIREIEQHPKSILSGGIHLVIPKSHKDGLELISRFNKGLRKLKADGRYQQYVEESLRGDYQP